MRALIDAGFCVVAPDTPGFGRSDPLSGEPSIERLAAATVEFLRALKLTRVAICGLHTGALLAVEAAHQAPELVALAIADGYPIFTDAECADYLRDYLPDNPLRWDGAHLTWLWARMREQSIFFPWHAKSPQHRLQMPLPATALIHEQLLAALQLGNCFAQRYGAVWRDSRRVSRLQTTVVPTKLLYRRDDPLAMHQPRLPTLPSCIQVAELADKTELADTALAALISQRAELGVSRADQLLDLASALRWPRHIVRTQAGGIGVRAARIDACPTVFLSAPGTSHPQTPSAGIAVDLPGHGDSDTVDPAWCEPGRMAQLLSQMLTRLQLERYNLEANAGSATYALALARIDGARMRQLLLIDPPQLTAEQRCAQAAADAAIALTPHGGHLLNHWQRLRDRALWSPHFQRDPAHAIDNEAALAPLALQRALLDQLQLGELATAMMQAIYSVDIAQEVRFLDVPCKISRASIQP